jgi:hypothetical protein
MTMSTFAGPRVVDDGRPLGRMAVLAMALLVAAQATDYLTFLIMVREHGLTAELNPLVVALATKGLLMLTIAKAAAVVLVASTFVVTRSRRPGLARLTLAVGIIVGAIGASSNLAAM